MEEDCQDEVTSEVVALWATLGLGGRHICLMTAQQLELLVWHWTCLQSDHQKAGCRPFSEEKTGKKTRGFGRAFYFWTLVTLCLRFMHLCIRFPRSLPVVEMFSSEGLLRRCGSTNRLGQNVATKMSNFYIKHPQKHLTNSTRNPSGWHPSKFPLKSRASNKTLQDQCRAKPGWGLELRSGGVAVEFSNVLLNPNHNWWTDELKW